MVLTISQANIIHYHKKHILRTSSQKWIDVFPIVGQSHLGFQGGSVKHPEAANLACESVLLYPLHTK